MDWELFLELFLCSKAYFDEGLSRTSAPDLDGTGPTRSTGSYTI